MFFSDIRPLILMFYVLLMHQHLFERFGLDLAKLDLPELFPIKILLLPLYVASLFDMDLLPKRQNLVLRNLYSLKNGIIFYSYLLILFIAL